MGGNGNSAFGTDPVVGGVFELLELLGLIDPVVEPPEDSFNPHDHLLVWLLFTRLRPLPAATPPVPPVIAEDGR